MGPYPGVDACLGHYGIYTVLCLFYTCSLFEEEISRMNPQAIVPPQPLQPPPTVGEYVYVCHVMYYINIVFTLAYMYIIFFIHVYTINNNIACLILRTLSCIVLLKLLRYVHPHLLPYTCTVVSLSIDIESWKFSLLISVIWMIQVYKELL